MTGMGHSLRLRVLTASGAVLVLVAPAAVAAAFAGTGVVSPIVLGGMVGLLTSLAAGRRGALTAAVLLALLTPVAAAAGLVPVAGAALMALMSLASGITALWGLHTAFTLIPLVLAYWIIEPPALTPGPVDRLDDGYLLAGAALMAGGALWTGLLVPFLHRSRTRPTPAAAATAFGYTAMITVLTAALTFLALQQQVGARGAWLVSTTIAVAKLGPWDSVQRAGQRVVGTVLGAVAAGLLAATGVGYPWLVVGAMLCLVVGLVLSTGPRYWLYVAFITPVAVLLTPGDPQVAEGYRIAYTVIAAGLVALTGLLALLWQQLAPGSARPQT